MGGDRGGERLIVALEAALDAERLGSWPGADGSVQSYGGAACCRISTHAVHTLHSSTTTGGLKAELGSGSDRAWSSAYPRPFQPPPAGTLVFTTTVGVKLSAA